MILLLFNGHDGLIYKQLRENINVCISLWAYVVDFMNIFATIHQAVKENNLVLVESLLLKGCNVDIVDDNHNTPLIYGIWQKNLLMVGLLLNSGADVNYRNHPHLMSPLMYASALHLPHICRLLIKYGAEVNLTNDDDTSPLMIACYRGYGDIVQILFNAGASINHQDLDGDNSLHLAIKANHAHIVSFLADRGADLYVGEGALNTAIDYNNTSLVKTLLNQDINVNQGNRDDFTPLINACGQGNIEIVKMLLEKGADVNLQDIEGETALHLACLEGHFYLVKLLLKRGALVNVINKQKDTPLFIACLQGHGEIVAELLKYGANPNHSNHQETPLSVATVNNYLDIIYILLKEGANPNARLADGKTILMKMCDQNNLDMMHCLLQYNADVNLEDKGGGTALMWSAHRGHLEGVKLLVEVAGIKIDHRNHQGHTAESLAEYNQFHEVAQFLKEQK